MTNQSEYWKDRIAQAWASLDESEEAFYSRLSKYYEKEAKELEKEVALYYQKYGKDNVLAYTDLLKDLTDYERDLLYRDMNEFFLQNPKHAHLQPIRENFYKVSRLEGLKQSVYLQQLKIGVIEESMFNEHFNSALNKALDILYKGNSNSFNVYNKSIIEKALGMSWVNDKNFSGRIWDNREALADYLNNDFIQALARGDSYESISKKLRERFTNVSRNNASRLIYTEGTFLLNESMMSVFETEYTWYRYSAVLDGKTSAICTELNRKEFLIKERQAGVNFPPMHVGCRSSFEIITSADDAIPNIHYQRGNFNKKELEQTLKEFENFLDSEWNEYSDLLKKAFNETKIIVDGEYKGTFGYANKIDALIINPLHIDFGLYDLRASLLHEIGHKIDNVYLKMYDNPVFKKEIDKAIAYTLVNKETLQLKLNGSNDIMLHDILSALSSNHLDLIAGHTDEYWNIPNKVEKEIMANFISIYSQGNEESIQVLEQHFPKLVAILKKEIGGIL